MEKHNDCGDAFKERQGLYAAMAHSYMQGQRILQSSSDGHVCVNWRKANGWSECHVCNKQGISPTFFSD